MTNSICSCSIEGRRVDRHSYPSSLWWNIYLPKLAAYTHAGLKIWACLCTFKMISIPKITEKTHLQINPMNFLFYLYEKSCTHVYIIGVLKWTNFFLKCLTLSGVHIELYTNTYSYYFILVINACWFKFH